LLFFEDKKKDEYLDEPFPQPYHDPNKPVEGFPTNGFPAPLPGKKLISTLLKKICGYLTK
jgi:hypothetical protein